MEGPSLIIAREEFKKFIGKKITEARGRDDLPLEKLKGNKLKQTQSWGKHFILVFDELVLKIHFLMFGSYRIDDPRENRFPKLALDIGESTINFYSCSIKELPKGWKKLYDWSVDLMSPQWDPAQALKKLNTLPATQVADVLMDQNIFSGLGNIMKNEILYILKMHPETKLKQLTASRKKALIRESELYAWQFYEWKKKNVLKRNWKIMRKKKCPHCGGKVTKKLTGKSQRWSHYCIRCQKKK